MKYRFDKKPLLTLSLLPENLQEEVRNLQKRAQANFKSNPGIQRYSVDFMRSLDESQQEQIIKFLYATPLHKEVTSITPLPKRKRWLRFFWHRNNHPTNSEFFLVERRLVLSDSKLILAEQGRTFVVRTTNPQP